MQPDYPLSRVLQSWRVTPRTDANFRTGVWQRIEAARQADGDSWSAYLRHRLAVWTIVAGVLTGGSGIIGLTAAREQNEASRQKMVAAYVASIDARAQLRP